MLPLSHDEVVHGKGSLIAKIPGDRWQKLATLRALYGFMWAHPGKKLLFMGCDFAQSEEWSESRSLDWHLTNYDEHQGVQRSVASMNSLYRATPSLWQKDTSAEGFTWIKNNDGAGNTLAFTRWSDNGTPLVCITNFSPVPHEQYALALPKAGTWYEAFNSDDLAYGGSGVKNGDITSLPGQETILRVPPLGTIWLALR